MGKAMLCTGPLNPFHNYSRDKHKRKYYQCSFFQKIDLRTWFVQTCRGPFSAVWTATIATKGSFCRDFRDLQDLHSFAPLKSQNFNEKVTAISCHFFWFWAPNFRKFAIFGWIFMKICRNFTESLRKCRLLSICHKICKFLEKNPEIFGIRKWMKKVHSFISSFQSYLYR